MAAKKKAKKAKVKAVKKKSLTLINLKVTGKDRAVLIAKAKQHAGGNYSAWLRHAGMNYVPKKGEVIR